ncbi:MAG TPA: nuclear transport factor 2 family protein [Chitinophagaceae bacterium]|nr:nuclear transport factor 2 family protein [Chitinophagaceae bacterium]
MSAEEELLSFVKEWDAAMVRNDAGEIASYLSDDWVIVGGDGITAAQDFLVPVRSGDLTHNKMESNDIRLKIYGNMGVVTSRGTSAGMFMGQSFSIYEWQTSIFVKEGGRWKCVITMLTEAKK